MERAARITETVLARRELAEIPCGVWYHVIEQAEHDSACRLRVDGDVELLSGTQRSVDGRDEFYSSASVLRKRGGERK